MSSESRRGTLVSTAQAMLLGPVITDVEGLELTAADVRRLTHPLVGGVVLFARNYTDPDQLCRLTESIHALRTPALLIVVDHEGGRVQRFHKGFTTIPPMRQLGNEWERSPERARQYARACGLVIGTELAAHGVDFSFGPVLDLDWGGSTVIGHRAFSRDPQVVAELAGAVVEGMHAAGIASCGKHFPGHGHVRADSHHEVPRDVRTKAELDCADLLPFKALAGQLRAIMPAHVIYEQMDAQPAGFSSFWLKKILQGDLQFQGLIFSDDLSMEGASVAGGPAERAVAAMDAGCDMVLMCNDQARCEVMLEALNARGWQPQASLSARAGRLAASHRGRHRLEEHGYLEARTLVNAISVT